MMSLTGLLPPWIRRGARHSGGFFQIYGAPLFGGTPGKYANSAPQGAAGPVHALLHATVLLVPHASLLCRQDM